MISPEISARDDGSLPKIFDGSDGTKSISFHGWTIQTVKKPICGAQQLEEYDDCRQTIQKELSIPLPEMLFGNSFLSLSHEQLQIAFTAVDSLKLVDGSPEAADRIKVACHRNWTESSKASHGHIQNVIKPYDWTYTTNYNGTVTRGSFEDSHTDIDLTLLRRPDPILFYEEMILFEDELADNGAAILNVRVRVMPTCFLVLMRFFLRVDDVLIRINDTRLFHSFGSSYVIREYQSREAPYDVISARLDPPTTAGAQDKTLLTNSDWVFSQMKESHLKERVLEMISLK